MLVWLNWKLVWRLWESWQCRRGAWKPLSFCKMRFISTFGRSVWKVQLFFSCHLAEYTESYLDSGDSSLFSVLLPCFCPGLDFWGFSHLWVWVTRYWEFIQTHENLVWVSTLLLLLPCESKKNPIVVLLWCCTREKQLPGTALQWIFRIFLIASHSMKLSKSGMACCRESWRVWLVFLINWIFVV